jgi:hypothetical protein
LRSNNKTRPISPQDFLNKFGTKSLENTIDHITPQTPDFVKYTEEFKRDWLHNIGNLTLIGWGNNSSKGNNNPVDEASLYDNDYYSNKEIRDVLIEKGVWGQDEIRDRRDRIISFVKLNWNL